MGSFASGQNVTSESICGRRSREGWCVVTICDY